RHLYPAEALPYRSVGADEADFKQTLIPGTSPIARGRVGKGLDDVVTITPPGAQVEFEIIKVNYL
ncbi:GreA/GreB family elongation factor, partial [Cronobacter sakazakii]|uniref:GreA/GreB family elongation factor n=1 Tax=Cronobacter sakazakii TaxID=28141 RepID=UPI000D4DCA47